MKVLISGGGIAGPTLAYWLQKSGHEVLLVEHSPRLRSGGYVIDFWGVGYDIAEKMGLIPRIRELGVQQNEGRARSYVKSSTSSSEAGTLHGEGTRPPLGLLYVAPKVSACAIGAYPHNV